MRTLADERRTEIVTRLRQDGRVVAAELVAKLVRSGQVIFLDAGTTALEVARALPPELEATIVTNSPPAASALADHPSAEVILLGGQLRKDAIAAAGAATVEAIERIQADVCILGVCSLHPEIGISVLDLEESYVKRAMIDHAAEVVAVTASDKLGSAGPYVVGPLDQLTHLVTDSTVSDELLEPFRALGIEVTLA